MSIFVRVAALALVALLVQGSPALAQEKKEKKDPTPEQQAEIRALLTLADDAAAGKATSTIPLEWAGQHFIKSHEDRTYVPFTVAVAPGTFQGSTPLALYLRVMKRGEMPPSAAAAPSSEEKDKKEDEKTAETRTEFPFEDVFFVDLPAPAAGEPALLRRAFAVPPGDYDVYFAVKEVAKKSGDEASAQPALAGVVKQEVTVPSMSDGLTTSSIILADKVEELSAPIPGDKQSEQPYTFGQMRIVPSADAQFSKAGDLNVIFWIYGAGTDPATKKPNVQVEYNFHQKLAEGGEKFFNRTDPAMMNAETLPPQFDLAAGHQLPGSLAVPLASFPAGDFRLEVKVTDKTNGQSITRDVPFTVTAQ